VRSWARRNPGTFLLAAAGAGMLAGRLTRATTQAVKSDQQQSTPDYQSFSTAPVSEYPTGTAAPASVPTTGYSTTGYSSSTPPVYGSDGGVDDPTGTPSTYGSQYGQEPLR
jgi:hypothetical protein